MFPSMGHALAKQRFHSYENVRKWLDEGFASKEKEFFWRDIHKLPEIWEKGVASEKNGKDLLPHLLNKRDSFYDIYRIYFISSLIYSFTNMLSKFIQDNHCDSFCYTLASTTPHCDSLFRGYNSSHSRASTGSRPPLHHTGNFDPHCAPRFD